MKSLLLSAAAFAASAWAIEQPFWPVETAAAAAAAAPVAKRQNQGCIPNFFSCANQGAVFAGVCCQSGQSCALDYAGNPACCPSGAVCTGTAPANFVAPTGATTAVSFVPNTYFSFPFVATYFASGPDCSAAVGQCSANYAACTARLQGLGGGFGVTIAVPGGGGTTITGGVGTTYDPARATSVCNSLSSAACRGLQPSMCTLASTSVNGFIFGSAGTTVKPALGYAGFVAAAVAAGMSIVAVVV